VEKSPVQVVENFFEMIIMPARRVDVLAAPDLPDKAGLRGNIMARHIAPVASALGSIHRFAIELREQDVRDRLQHIFGSTLKQVRDARVNLPLPQANCIVDGDKGIEADVHRRKCSARAKFAKGLVEDFGELYGHVDGRVARPAVGWPGGDARRSIGYFLLFFLRFTYSSTSATVLRWSSALESTVSRASVSRNSYWLASSAFVLAEFFSARNLD